MRNFWERMRKGRTGAVLVFCMFLLLQCCCVSALAEEDEAPENSPMAGYMNGWLLNTSGESLDSGSRCVNEVTVKIEEGQEFYLQDYFLLYKDGDAITGRNLPLRYTSTNASVAKVSAKGGKVRTVKTGTADIRTSCDGRESVCHLKVVKKGSLGSTTTYAAVNKAANKLKALRGKKITSKNGAKALKLAIAYRKAVLASKKVQKAAVKSVYLTRNQTLSVPMAGVASAICEDVREYAFQANAKNHPKAASVTAKAGTSRCTVTLKKALTEAQFQAIAYMAGCDYGTKASDFAKKTVKWRGAGYSSIRFRLKRADGDTIDFTGAAFVTKGSRKVSIKQLSNLSEDEDIVFRKGDVITTVKGSWGNAVAGKVK